MGSGFLFNKLPGIKTEHISGTVTGNIPLLYKCDTGEKTVIEVV